MLACGKNMPKNNEFPVFGPELIKNCPEKVKKLPRKQICPKFGKIYPKIQIYPGTQVQPIFEWIIVNRF